MFFSIVLLENHLKAILRGHTTIHPCVGETSKRGINHSRATNAQINRYLKQTQNLLYDLNAFIKRDINT